MKYHLIFLTVWLPFSAESVAQNAVPPDHEGLLRGEGMGLARLAEENGYPGPKHVLELRNELGLSPDQFRKVEALREGVRVSARIVGQQIVEKETELSNLYRTASADEVQVQSLLREIGTLRADLRFIHLQAHMRMREILTPGQIGKYYELREHEVKEK